MKKQHYLIVSFMMMFLSISLAQNLQIDSTKWFSNGPYSAHITCLDIAPGNSNIMYLGTYAGTIYKSTDGGEHWSRCATEGLDDMKNHVGTPYNSYITQSWWDGDYAMIRLITVDPLDENHVWIAPVSGSLYESKDGGNTWQKTDDSLPSDCYYIQALNINPENPNDMLAGTHFWGDSIHESGLYRTTNGGEDWELIEELPHNSGTLNSTYVQCIVRDFNDKNHVIVSMIGSRKKLFETTDNGNTWNVLYQTEYALDIGSIVMNPHNSLQLFGLIAGGYGNVFFAQSDDGGKTWYRPESNISNRKNCYQLYADADCNLYMEMEGDHYYENNIVKSTDLGKTWTPVDQLTNRPFKNGNMALSLTCRANPKNTNKVFFGTHFGLYVSDDGGETTTLHNNGLNDAYIRDIEVNPKNPNVIYAASFQGLWKSEDGGENWNVLITDPVYSIKCDPLYPDTLYAGGYSFWRSFNGGESFKKLQEGSFFVISELGVHPQKTNIIFKLSDNDVSGLLFRSTDRGETWSLCPEVYPWYMEMLFDKNHPDTMYIKRYGSYDAGISWNEFTHPLDFDLKLVGIVGVHPEQSNIIYNKVSSPQGLAVSYDYGHTHERLVSFSQTCAFPNYYIKNFHIDENQPNTLFYSTGIENMHYSDDSGANWGKIPGNYNTRITDIQSNIANNRIVLATYGSGVWVYKNTDNIPEQTPSDTKKINVYPNPFAQEVQVKYELQQESQVLLEIFNINGQKVQTLVNDMQTKGMHHITWNGLQQNGQQGAPGLYVIRLQTGEEVTMQKVLYVK